MAEMPVGWAISARIGVVQAKNSSNLWGDLFCGEGFGLTLVLRGYL